MTEARQGSSRGELALLSAHGTSRAVDFSAAPYIDGAEALCVVVTDLSQQKRSDALVADEGFRALFSTRLPKRWSSVTLMDACFAPTRRRERSVGIR
jgi:hypothetical protein